MRVAGDFHDLQSAGIEPFEREFVPRVAAAAVSVFALTTLACVFLLALSYLLMYGFSPWGFDSYTRTVARVFTPLALGGLGLKCIAFGAVVAVIPISARLGAAAGPRAGPGAGVGGVGGPFFPPRRVEIPAPGLQGVRGLAQPRFRRVALLRLPSS